MGAKAATCSITHLAMFSHVHFETRTTLNNKADVLIIVDYGHTGRRVCFHFYYYVAAILVDKSSGKFFSCSVTHQNCGFPG